MYTDVDYPHKPTDHPDWHESFVLVFRDEATSLSGFIRTGAYVNQGHCQVHWGMALPDGRRFRRNRPDIHWKDEYLTDTSFQSGEYVRYSVESDHVRFQGWDEDAELDIRFYDYFPSQDWEPVGVQAPEKLRGGSNHPESGGRVEGRVRIGDEIIEIAGFGHHDHSFGPRNITRSISARWHAGNIGPALAFSLVTTVGEDRELYKFGWLMRNGVREKLRDLHHVNMVLSDGFSTIGGYTMVELESGERLRIEATVMDGMVNSTITLNGGPGSTPATIDSYATLKCGDLQGGVSDFMMLDNAHNGEEAVYNILLADTEQGLSRRNFDPSWLR